jgi:hypothetical protein
MRRSRAARRAALAVGFLVVGATARDALAESPAPPSGEHARVAGLVHALEQDAAHKTVMAEALAHAEEALERATRMRDANDEAHARLADAVALEWAATANDLRRAADQEAQAADLRKKAEEARAQAERTRGLVEEAIARVGRLKAELVEADHASRDDRTAVEIHDDDATPPKKKKKKTAATPAPTAPTAPAPAPAPPPSRPNDANRGSAP